MLHLARECHSRTTGGFLAFVHVSTDYVSVNSPGVVEETLCKPSIDEMFVTMPEDELTKRAHEICSGFADTFFVAKMMTEHLMSRRALEMHLPLVIVRPSIIGCMWRGLKPGWTDGIMGSNAAVLMLGTGVFSRMVGDCRVIFDVIPVDTVIDVILAAAACLRELQVSECHVPIVHATSSSTRPLLVGEFFRGIETYFLKHPSSTKQFQPCMFNIDPRQVQQGGALAQAATKCIHANTLFAPMLTNEWIFKTSNMSKLITLLDQSGEPRQAYSSLELHDLDWGYYMQLYCYGVRRFLLREADAFRIVSERNIDEQKSSIREQPVGVTSRF